MGHIAIVEVLISSWVALEGLRTYSLNARVVFYATVLVYETLSAKKKT